MVKFIQKLKQCSYERAIGYLDGWLDQSKVQSKFSEELAISLPPKPKQLELALYALQNEGGF